MGVRGVVGREVNRHLPFRASLDVRYSTVRSPLDETACGDLAISRLIRDRVVRDDA